jgi:hypothetical protein
VPKGAGLKSDSGVPKVEVREVNTDKFLWKVSKGLTGNVEVQVSEAASGLGELVRSISANPQALVHFANFLGELDRAGVQAKLMSQPSGKQPKASCPRCGNVWNWMRPVRRMTTVRGAA